MVEEKVNEKVENKADSEIEGGELLNRLRRVRIANIWAVRIFFVLFFAVFVVSFILPLRPSYSDTERRELDKFPKLTVKSLMSGDYFSGIERWYSDTFPGREFLLSADTGFKNAFGINDVVITGDLESGDEIPDVPPTDESGVSADAESSEAPVESTAPAENSTPSVTTPPAESQPAAPPPPTTQTLGALLVCGDSAYEYYNFNQGAADIYVSALNRAGLYMQGKANVYDIIVPTSMGITAPDDVAASVNISNQKSATDYFYSVIGNGVKCVNVFDTLKAKRNEYVYFRTDHHWTALGAYYSYTELMKTMGIQPHNLTDYIEYQFPGFLGTFYNSSGKLPQLSANPDTVYAYCPLQTNTLSVFNGAWRDFNIISDMSASTPGNKYMTFIRGDQPLSRITNPELADGSTCIVIKESFGNCFVPFLVPHYQYIYIVDYRHISKVDRRGLVQLQADSGAKDIIFINNLSATRNKDLVSMINYFVR